MKIHSFLKWPILTDFGVYGVVLYAPQKTPAHDPILSTQLKMFGKVHRMIL